MKKLTKEQKQNMKEIGLLICGIILGIELSYALITSPMLFAYCIWIIILAFR